MTYNVFSGTLNPTHFTSPEFAAGLSEVSKEIIGAFLPTGSSSWRLTSAVKALVTYFLPAADIVILFI